MISKPTRNRLRYPFTEELEPRVYLAGDVVAGALGAQASLIADDHPATFSFEVISDVAIQDTTFLLRSGSPGSQVELWEVGEEGYKRLRVFEGTETAPLTKAGDRIYFAITTVVEVGKWGTPDFTTEIWSIDPVESALQLEATPLEYSDGNADDVDVFIREIGEDVFVAVTWFDFGADQNLSTLWSNANGSLETYERTGGVTSINRFADEFYLEIDNTWYNGGDGHVFMMRTNPLSMESNLVWEKSGAFGMLTEYEEFEEVPEFEDTSIPETTRDWSVPAVDQLFLTEAPKRTSQSFYQFMPTSNGVLFRSDVQNLLFTDGVRIEKVLDVAPGYLHSTIEDRGIGYVVRHEDGRIQNFSIESDSFHLYESNSIGTPNRILQVNAATAETTLSVLPAGVEVMEGLGSVAGRDLYLSNRGQLWSLTGAPVLLADTRQIGLDFGTAVVNGRIWVWSSTRTKSTLLASDGSSEGTLTVNGPGVLQGVFPSDDEVLFVQQGKLWSSDGTSAERTELPALPGVGAIRLMEALDDSMILVGDDHKIWRSDGTPEGTILLKQFNDRPVEFVLRGDSLFFVANDEQHGTELWTTDGTPAGTQLAADVFPGPSDSRPEHLTVSNDHLVFVADDGTHGRELWKIDFSEQAEALLADADSDGAVSFADFLILSMNYGRETDEGQQAGDFDADGLVSFNDFLILSATFGRKR